MKKLHDYTDKELIESFYVEVLGHKLIDEKNVPSYSVDEEKFCFYSNGILRFSDPYHLSEENRSILNKNYGYMYRIAKADLENILPHLNKFLYWTISKFTNNERNLFNIVFDSHIKRHYKMESGIETSFERAVLIALILNVRNKDNSVQTEKSY